MGRKARMAEKVAASLAMQRKIDAACARPTDLSVLRGSPEPCAGERARGLAQRVYEVAMQELGVGVDAGPVAMQEGGVSLKFDGPRESEVVFIIPQDGAWVWAFCGDDSGCDWTPDPATGEAGWRVALVWLAAVKDGETFGLRTGIALAGDVVGARKP